MKADCFDIKKDDRVVIYGAAAIGKTMASAFTGAGVRPYCFLDNNWPELSTIDDIPVFDPDKFGDIKNDSAVFCISLTNGTENEALAAQFHEQYGIDRIIFLPLYMTFSVYRKRLMRNVYNDIFRGIANFSDIPLFKEYDYKYRVIDDLSEKYISLWYPAHEILVTAGRITDVKIYRALYSYIETGEGDLTAYFEKQSKVNRRGTREEILADRTELFQLFKKELEYGTGFFEDMPSPAIWSEADKSVRLKEGMHRSQFLLYQGYSEIPICMPISDYYKMTQEERQ